MPKSELIKQLIGGPSDFGIGWMIILISSVITILIAGISFWKWLSARIQSKRRQLKKISLLTIGTHLDYFKALLGDPVFINKVGNYDEYIFVSHYFFVQALTDTDGKIALFSVTTRRKRFNPVLKINGLNITLGKTKFSELGEPEKTMTHPGDHGGISTYSEIHYYGNSGNYLKYVFTINGTGYGNAIFDIPLYFYLSDESENPTALKKFRANAAINTYTISGFFWDKNWEGELDNEFEFGPKNFQIRILNE